MRSQNARKLPKTRRDTLEMRPHNFFHECIKLSSKFGAKTPEMRQKHVEKRSLCGLQFWSRGRVKNLLARRDYVENFFI